jgi:hypothetical protein
LYRRYLDDIFGVIMASDMEEAQAMLEELNELHCDIKLEFKVSENEARFLDLHIFKGPRFESSGKLDTATHFKAMNPFLYMHYRSYHSRSVKLGFVKAELLRLVRNSSSKELFLESGRQFYYRLLRRGYPEWFLEEAFAQVSYTALARSRLLHGSNAVADGDSNCADGADAKQAVGERIRQRVVLKMLRAPVTTQVKWPEVLNSAAMRSLLKGSSSSSSRVQLSWVMPPSLGDRLVRAALRPG